MSQSGVGRIEIFEDFLGEQDPVAVNQDGKRSIGSFRVVGAGSEDASSGVTINEGDPSLGGVGRLTSSETQNSDVCALVTSKCFDAALMGTLIMEVRVQFPNLATKAAFIGFCDTNDVNETIPASISGATITLTADHQVGFCFDNDANSTENWYYTYKGGSVTGITVAATNDSGVTIVAQEWDILRVEVDPNGTARWYINGVLKKTLNGALSTSANVCAFAGVETESSSSTETMDLDYFLVRANRDWTR